jgi:pimeloyl-ACP methyl ester carboxylesterase
VAALLALAAGVLWAWPGLLPRAALSWERWRSGLAEKSVVVDGDTVPYLEGGSGETVLLVHGFGANKDNWTRFARFLTPRHRVVALDVPGFGESTRDSSKSYDIEAQAQRLHRFAETLGLERFHLAGNSMGGQISAVYAASHPDQVLSLGLIATAGITSPKPAEMAAILAQGTNPLLVDMPEDFDRLLGLVFVKPPYLPGPLKTYFLEQAREHRAFNQKVWADVHERPAPLEPRLAQIRARTLVLWGDADRVLDVSAVQVLEAGLQPKPRVVILKSCGHVPMAERPEEAAEHYLRFVAGDESSS